MIGGAVELGVGFWELVEGRVALMREIGRLAGRAVHERPLQLVVRRSSHGV